MTPLITFPRRSDGGFSGRMGTPGNRAIWGRIEAPGSKGGNESVFGIVPSYTPRFDKLCPIQWSRTFEEFKARFTQECKALALDWAQRENGAQVVIPQGCEEDRDFIIRLGAILKRNSKRKYKGHDVRLQSYLKMNWKSGDRLWEMTHAERAEHINERFKTQHSAATLKMRCYRMELFGKREGGPRYKADRDL